MMNHQSSVIIHQSSIISQSSIRDQSEINQRSLGINLTFFCHQVGRMKVAGAFDKCIRRRIKRSFICDWSRGLILVQIYHFFEKCPDLGNLWGPKTEKKSEMMDGMGRNRSKFGNFDTGRCASISGPRKSRFWPIFPNFFNENLDFSVWGLALESCYTSGGQHNVNSPGISQ